MLAVLSSHMGRKYRQHGRGVHGAGVLLQSLRHQSVRLVYGEIGEVGESRLAGQPCGLLLRLGRGLLLSRDGARGGLLSGDEYVFYPCQKTGLHAFRPRRQADGVGHFPGVLVAGGRPLLQAFHYHHGQRRGQAGVELRRRPALVLRDGLDEGRGSVALERVFERHQLVEHGAEAVDVGGRRGFAAGEGLRRHIAQRAQHRLPRGDVGGI